MSKELRVGDAATGSLRPLEFNHQGNCTDLHRGWIFHLHLLRDLVSVDHSATSKIIHLQTCFALDPRMALSNSLAIDREHITGSLGTNHKLRLTGINCADNA